MKKVHNEKWVIKEGKSTSTETGTESSEDVLGNFSANSDASSWLGSIFGTSTGDILICV